jgi:hypothetical protein
MVRPPRRKSNDLNLSSVAGQARQPEVSVPSPIPHGRFDASHKADSFIVAETGRTRKTRTHKTPFEELNPKN